MIKNDDDIRLTLNRMFWIDRTILPNMFQQVFEQNGSAVCRSNHDQIMRKRPLRT